MRRRLLSALLLVSQACTTGVPSELESARGRLAAALQTRDVATVSDAARAASAFEGQDPALDRLIGDALANVLMRPADGLPLLAAHPDPHDPEWTRAYESAALRTSDPSVLAAARTATETTGALPTPALIAWVGAQALRDPAVSIDTLDRASAACSLWDAQPPRGRRSVDQPVSEGFFEALPQLGATTVIIGRATVPTDPAPSEGTGLQPCEYGRIWPDAAWPRPLPRHLTVAIGTPAGALYLSVQPVGGEPWVFASAQAELAGELVAHVRDVEAGTPADPRWLRDRLAAAPAAAPPPVPH